MTMDPVLLIPRRPRGGRYCNQAVQAGEYFEIAKRTQGTNDICFCAWVNLRSFGSGNRPFWYAHSPTYNTGFSVYFRVTTRMLQVSYGNGSAMTDLLATTDAIPIGSWTFIAINFDRDGNCTAHLNGSATPIIDADISGAVAADWSVTPASWNLGGVWNSTHDVYISRVGLSVGNLLTTGEIATLYNNGTGLTFAELTGDLITKFTGQDYWDCRELSGPLLNAATPARTAIGKNTTLGTTTAIKSVTGPRL